MDRQEAELQLGPDEQLWKSSDGPCVLHYTTRCYRYYFVQDGVSQACTGNSSRSVSKDRHRGDIETGRICERGHRDAVGQPLVWVVVRA